MEAVNKRRKVLNLPEVALLAADTKLDAGLTDTAKTPDFNKESILHPGARGRDEIFVGQVRWLPLLMRIAPRYETGR